ncbi:hypothetical protein Pelo_10690 [Pelomyxa schiedti]|nr:hypothetical protein Pelo_10690 [Pelomyxa schiedti]
MTRIACNPCVRVMGHTCGPGGVSGGFHYVTWCTGGGCDCSSECGNGEYCLWSLDTCSGAPGGVCGCGTGSNGACNCGGKYCARLRTNPNSQHYHTSVPLHQHPQHTKHKNPDFRPTYSWWPRLLISRITNQQWFQDPSTPKNYIEDIQFCCTCPVCEATQWSQFPRGLGEVGCTQCEHSGWLKLLFAVRRTCYGTPSDNGIGLQMMCIDRGPPPLQYDLNFPEPPWFQVTDSIDPTDILCVKWTHTLLIGSIVSGAIIVKGKGMSELVDNCYSSAFLSLDNDFTQTAVNFTQYGRYYRFWTDIAGNVRVLLVTQQTPTIHPEWRDLTRCRADLVKLRLLASRVGYFINDISMDSKKRTDATYMKLKLPNYLTDSAPQAQPAKTKHPASVQNTSSATKTATTTPSTTSTTTICATSKTSGTNLWSGGKELASAVIGLHLHRCHQCRVVLGKPLRCGGCMAATYCSKECQKQHWAKHRSSCNTCTRKESLHTPGSQH